MKNQYNQESSGQYQGHWQDIKQVSKYFQTQDSQDTLQGIKIAHDGQAKLRCPQLQTQAENHHLVER